MKINKTRFDLYISTQHFPLNHIADCVIEEDARGLTRVGFRYRPDYLTSERTFPLCPVSLPLIPKEFVFPCRGGIPGFLDDYLPDAWGRKVIAHIARYRDQKTISSHSVTDVLTYLGRSRIGAIQLVEPGVKPEFELGCDYASLANAERAANDIEEGAFVPDRAINNTDDHERNFSLIHRGDGFMLAPAYDMVPSVSFGEYHAAGFKDSPSPPKPSQIKGRIFGLSATKVATVAEQVIEAVKTWTDCASTERVSDEEITKIQRCLTI